MSLVAALALAACEDDDSARTDADPGDLDATAGDAGTDGQLIDAMIDAPPGPSLNGCTEATALDRTELADRREIVIGDGSYIPACMRIRAGQGVRWNADLTAHPLRPGVIAGGTRMPQAGNPIPATSSGSTVFVSFPAAGAFGFYCDVHWAAGMKGAIYVVP